MNYTTRVILKLLFGDDPLRFSSPVVGVRQPRLKRFRYNFKIPGVAPKDISNTFWRLRKKKIIKYREENGKVHILLTEAGKKKVLSYRLDDLNIARPRRWDGKWHIIAFDIPEKNKVARNALSNKLKQLGLIMFQKSLWIYPFYCKAEVDFISEILEVGKYVHYMVVENVTNDSLLRQEFGLR